MRRGILYLGLVLCLSAAGNLLASDNVRINLPKKNRMTPVQSLNRDGVRAVKAGHTDKAKRMFMQAYLLDPDDPFTLNNLGYISELEGDADHALKYYELAAHFGSEALIDEASKPGLKGHTFNEAFSTIQASAFASNRPNLQAIVLLQKGRTIEAESLLKSAMQADHKNPFLLDNMGYAMESEGDLETAQYYYSSSAALHSDERVLLTPNPKWRGKPISEVAGQSADAVRAEIEKEQNDPNARVARLNLRGVSALNHNEIAAAKIFFADAYKLDAKNAFTLNNLGYIAELTGDRETAETYYEAAGGAGESTSRVTYATRADAEGQNIGALAGNNQVDVESRLKAIRDEKQRTRRPIELKRRDGTSVQDNMQDNTPRQQAPLEVEPPALPPLQLPDQGRGTTNDQPSAPQSPSTR